jgi:hypothetical protein
VLIVQAAGASQSLEHPRQSDPRGEQMDDLAKHAGVSVMVPLPPITGGGEDFTDLPHRAVTLARRAKLRDGGMSVPPDHRFFA